MFQQITLCSKHIQPIIMYEGKIEGPNIKALCGACLQEKFPDYELLLPEQIHLKYQHQLNQSMSLNKNIIKKLKYLLNGLLDLQVKINRELDAFEQLIRDYILLIRNENEEENHYNIDVDEKQWLNNYIKSKLQEKLMEIQKNTDTRHFQNYFDLLNGTTKQKKKLKINYKKLSMLNIKYQCSSIAFNDINSILFVGTSQGFIKVYGFYNNKKLIQNLSTHKQNVFCLIFVKKLNQLVSGSNDKSIIIWKQGLENQWEPHQILLGDSILCIFMNKDEDLMISGGIKDIKFWKRYDLNWKCQQTIDSYLCFCVSSNASQKKLISCEFNKIKVFEQQANSGWIVAQIIKIKGWGHQLSFINEHQFVFQPKTKAFLEIYNYQERIKKFIQADLIKVQEFENDDYFPIRIIGQKDIVMVKHGNCVNFFGKNKNQNYKLCRKFQFGRHLIYGGLSNDGQFLIAGETQKLQILLLKYLD